MGERGLPRRAEDLIKSFAGFHDRAEYFQSKIRNCGSHRDDTFKDVRDIHIRLLTVFESGSSRSVAEELFKYLDKLTTEDRARSFLLLASEEGDKGQDWLDRIVESFEVSPKALRPQLLLAASIIGHESMVTLVLRDIATDEDLPANIDAVEGECLIEASRNQHFSIVKELLDGGATHEGYCAT
ncbi:hypothetical protein V7S43_009207 [Phytophthora oleae]|uniref:Uncharacterized protein n=1 Tax=Phytophthora oleae TaxID=2107226 RepID=A0ABD3FFQ0_9STRA